MFFFFSITVSQLWMLQIVRSDDLKEQAKMTGLIVNQTMAPRGKIFDRQMHVLADVHPKIVVTAIQTEVNKNPESLDRLALILGTTRKRLVYQMQKNSHKANFPVPIFVGATVQQAAKIAESGTDFPGVGVQTQAMRFTKGTAALEHILGNVWVPTEAIEKEFEESGIEYLPPYVGRDGIERTYEKELMGRPGSTTYTVDRRRRPLSEVMSEAPIPGSSLVLSLDLETQKVAKEALGNQKGAVVALDPKTGEVLAMVSTPGYDLGIYDGGLTQAESDSINLNPDRPLLKRAIAGRYPPGSTFKIATAMAAYQAGIFDEHTRVSCQGYLVVGNRKVRCENHPAGSFDFRMAMTKSCNSYFGKLSQRVDGENMKRTANQLGFGEVTGIDLPGENAGVVPDDAYVQENHGRRFSAGDANNIGIGQGDLLVTPLQMASLVSLVANEGVSYRPHVVRGVMKAGIGQKLDLVQPQVLHKFDASSQFWAILKGALRNVVVAGTGKNAQIPGVSVSGKTGSAENSVSRRTHAWFVGYAPAEDPKIAFAVIVETAGHGGTTAAPIAKKVIEAYLRKAGQKENSKALDIAVTVSPDNEPVDPDSP
ncbi:MAG: penicillin-binding protein 2 [Fimbriimonadaceae bacterium]